ncbi:MAG: bifunctional phosphopantothenoylcysteine decarboxylase/phosphopantothenate--cysteine ligase CoaBC, partial [Desulfobulbaceae bacterium]|nr:bifunctional phosphopantothenoylcysteine decarboxylase/phosphopantothenate--cysteine ligase CoaBC [Desulfobulbaceae bacterium]
MAGLTGKRILLGVTGSIAAYKAAEWTRALVKEEAQVEVILTEAAQRFVPALTFAALAGTAVHCDMFADDPEALMAHINLSREADALVIAPASAQTIARLAAGMADNLLSAVVLAARIPVLICPAMNTAMLNHPATQKNLRCLRQYGYRVLQPSSGELACGDVGDGRLPDWDEAREALLSIFAPSDLRGIKILITAGPTREAIDPVRYLSNRSSGKMGFALARTAMRRGASVTLVAGPVNLSDPPGMEVI